MKLLLFDDWKNNASLADGLTFDEITKIGFEMYQFAREMETYLKNQEYPNFQQYFQKALSFFHRYSHQVSFRKFDRHIYMVACLFLAAKDEDAFSWSLDRYVIQYLIYCTKRKDLPPPAKHLFPSDFAKVAPQEPLKPFDPQLVKIYSEKVCDAEAQILQMLGYDLDIVATQLYFNEAKKKIKINAPDVDKFWQYSQRFIIDHFVTNLCLYYQPKVLAITGMFQAADFMKNVTIENPIGKQWFQLFDTDDDSDPQNKVTMPLIEEVKAYFDKVLDILKLK